MPSTRLPRVLVGLLLLLPLACASLPGGRPEHGLGRIVETGVIRVGMSGEQPPLNMTDRRGELFGLEVALARRLASAMGFQVEFVRLPFHELLDALEAGRVDLVMSGMTITPERNRRVAFVGPYYVSGKSILARTGTLAAIEKPGDLDRADFRFAALAGSTSADFVRNLLPRATLVTTETLEEATRQVLSGEVDALVADDEVCAFAALRHPGRGLVALPTPLTVEPIGIALPPDDPLLANLLDNYLTALESTGQLGQARSYWFENPSWIQDLR